MIPRYLRKVTDYDDAILEEKYPEVQEVVSERTARIMTWMLREVVTHGTAVAASRMKYSLAGKTGTTNDFTDAWFMGSSPSLTCGVWIGFDDKRSLGEKETGAMAALPIWMQFMNAGLGSRDRIKLRAPTPELPTLVSNRPIETELSSLPPVISSLPPVIYDLVGTSSTRLLDSTKAHAGAGRRVAQHVKPFGTIKRNCSK